jgi:hypothetical protein
MALPSSSPKAGVFDGDDDTSATDETRARWADPIRRPQSRAEASVARVLLLAQCDNAVLGAARLR